MECGWNRSTDPSSATKEHRSWSWKEVGCRKDCTTLAGETKRSVECVTKQKAQRSADCTTARVGRRSDTKSQKKLSKCEQEAKTLKKDWNRQRGITPRPLSEGQWRESHLAVRRWESDKHSSRSIPVEGFRNHVATDGVGRVWMVSGAAGSRRGDGADGMYGTLDAELEVQRSIKGAELTASLSSLGKAIGPTMVHADSKGILTGSGGEMRCSGPRATHADLSILIWELHRAHQEGMLVGVEHVKAHGSKKEIQDMSLFEKFNIERQWESR